jgi:hypothetical protein
MKKASSSPNAGQDVVVTEVLRSGLSVKSSLIHTVFLALTKTVF